RHLARDAARDPVLDRRRPSPRQPLHRTVSARRAGARHTRRRTRPFLEARDRRLSRRHFPAIRARPQRARRKVAHMNDPLLIALALVSILAVLLTVLCIALAISMIRGRRRQPELAPALPVGVDVAAAEDVDITRVTAFLPSLADGDDTGDEA